MQGSKLGPQRGFSIFLIRKKKKIGSLFAFRLLRLWKQGFKSTQHIPDEKKSPISFNKSNEGSNQSARTASEQIYLQLVRLLFFFTSPLPTYIFDLRNECSGGKLALRDGIDSISWLNARRLSVCIRPSVCQINWFFFVAAAALFCHRFTWGYKIELEAAVASELNASVPIPFQHLAHYLCKKWKFEWWHLFIHPFLVHKHPIKVRIGCCSTDGLFACTFICKNEFAWFSLELEESVRKIPNGILAIYLCPLSSNI